MRDTVNENKENNELNELVQDSEETLKLSPAEEYKNAMKKKRQSKILFLLLFICEIAICGVFSINIRQNNLHYRTTRQIENTLTGQNKFATGVYTGETDFGYFVGDGTFEYATGSVFNGSWDKNHMHGVGILKIPSEGKYEGDFILSQKSGIGIFNWDDGSIYDGEWKNDQMNGQGTYLSSDKVKYAGTFKDNHFKAGTCDFENSTGKYTITYKEFEIDNVKIVFSDGTSYDGNSDGKTISGEGTMAFANGDKYIGDFDEGTRNGQGTYTWKNGDVYDGTWSNDIMTGIGSYTYADGSCAQGEFDKNQFVNGAYKVVNNFGEYTFNIEDGEAVSVEMKLASGTTYSGDMSDGKLTGEAQISYSNGDKYSGLVTNGRKTDQGTYIWSSGASYEGEWKNDKMHGQGTYLYSEKEKGYKLVGNFEKGVPVGSCQYYIDSSESYKTDWSNGKCVKVYE